MNRSLSCLLTALLYVTTANTMNDYAFEGSHFIASYRWCNQTALLDIEHLKEALLKAARASGAQILSHQCYEFPGGGFTMTILLSESHVSIHTYPEHCASCFVDLFTCGTHCSSSNFDRSLQLYLKPRIVDSQVIQRK